MTTMAAILGALPLMLGTGVGSELRHPLGVSIVGGLVFSQMLTLFTTPVVYLYFDRLAHRVRRLGASDARGARGGGRMNFSALFITRPIATTLLTMGLALAGVAAFMRLPVAPLPKWIFRRPVGVGLAARRLTGNRRDQRRRSAGAAARDDRRCDGDDLLEQRGQTNIILQFGIDRDIDGAARDVQAAINAAAPICPPASRPVRPIASSIRPMRRSSSSR